MNAFFEQFGLDWKIFLSQLFNFALILIILRAFVYRPLIKALKDRRQKIEEGLVKAEEANIRLKEVDQIAKGRIKEAEGKSLEILHQTEQKKKRLEEEMITQAKKREEELLKKAENLAKDKEKEMENQLQREAAEIVKSAIAKAINEKPDQVDEKLIKSAVSNIQKSKL